MMNNNIITWKKVLHEYSLFCLLQYGLIAMIAIKFSIVFFFKVGNGQVGDAISMLIFITIWFGVLMDIGIVIINFKPKLKILGGLVVTLGAVLQAFYIFKLSPSALTYKTVILFLVVTAVISMWTIALFFAFDKEAMTVVRKKNKKKSAIYYALAVTVLTYISAILLYRYFDSQINTLVTAGTVNRADGLDAAQVIALVDAKILQVDLIQTVFLIVLSVVFFWPYRKWVLGPDRGSEGSQV
jgi:hypothetical protein